MSDRRELGNLHGCRLSVLPPVVVRVLDHAGARAVRGGVEPTILGVPKPPWGPSWAPLAHPGHAGPAGGSARSIRYELLEVVHPCPVERAAGGERGCLSLFGNRAETHRLFGEHLTAEYRVRTEGRGRTVDEWKIRPERGDNHWFDGLVGCAVAASMVGVRLPATNAAPSRRRSR